MSTFRIGQRVRVVAPDSRFCGREAIVSSIQYGTEAVTNRSGYANICTVDGFGDWLDGLPIGFWDEDLEPLTNYDGNQVVSWEECLWRPEGVAA